MIGVDKKNADISCLFLRTTWVLGAFFKYGSQSCPKTKHYRSQLDGTHPPLDGRELREAQTSWHECEAKRTGEYYWRNTHRAQAKA